MTAPSGSSERTRTHRTLTPSPMSWLTAVARCWPTRPAGTALPSAGGEVVGGAERRGGARCGPGAGGGWGRRVRTRTAGRSERPRRAQRRPSAEDPDDRARARPSTARTGPAASRLGRALRRWRRVRRHPCRAQRRAGRGGGRRAGRRAGPELAVEPAPSELAACSSRVAHGGRPRAGRLLPPPPRRRGRGPRSPRPAGGPGSQRRRRARGPRSAAAIASASG